MPVSDAPRPVTLPRAIKGLDIMRTQVVVIVVGAQHVVDDHQNAVTDGHNGTQFANTMRQAMVLG